MKMSLILTFLTGILFASCSKNDPAPVIPPADKTVLRTTIASSQTTYEAEQAVLSGAVVASNQPGYTGSGFADYVNASRRLYRMDS